MRFWRIVGILAVISTMSVVASARISGVNPTGVNSDVWCVGKISNEVCVDATGNVIPTTTLDATLGTSSLYWNAAYINSLVVSGASALSGAATIGGNLIRSPYSQTVTAGATIKTASACGGLMLLSANSNVTAAADTTLDTATAANTGCIVDIINLGGGTITLNTLSNFRTKGYLAIGSIVLGTNNALQVAQTGSYWVVIGTIVVN